MAKTWREGRLLTAGLLVKRRDVMRRLGISSSRFDYLVRSGVLRVRRKVEVGCKRAAVYVVNASVVELEKELEKAAKRAK